MKSFCLILLSIFCLKAQKIDEGVLVLKKQKAATDEYLKKSKDVIVLAKVPGKKSLVKIVKDKFPDEVEYTYNILKDKTGKIIMIAQMPYSESGDWMIAYKHYFDVRGNVYCFQKEESLFDDSVKGGVVREDILKYYGDGFKPISQNSQITDKDEKPLKRKRQEFGFRNDKYAIHKNLKDCLSAYQIAL